LSRYRTPTWPFAGRLGAPFHPWLSLLLLALLVKALLATPVADEPEETEPVGDLDLIDLKKINNVSVKGVKATA